MFDRGRRRERRELPGRDYSVGSCEQPFPTSQPHAIRRHHNDVLRASLLALELRYRVAASLPEVSRDESSNRSDRAQSPRRCRADWPFRSSIRSAGPGGHCGSARPASCRLPGGREPRAAPGASRRIGRLANSAGSYRIGHHLALLALTPRRLRAYSVRRGRGRRKLQRACRAAIRHRRSEIQRLLAEDGLTAQTGSGNPVTLTV